MKKLSKASLKTKIAENDLKQVIEDLFSILSHHLSGEPQDKQIEDLYDQLILFSGKLAGLNQEIHLGIADSQYVNIEKSRITINILNLINSMPDKLFSDGLNNPNFVGVSDLRSKVANALQERLFEYDIFLSFSSKDRENVKQIWEELRGFGLKVFLSDESLKMEIGQSFFEKIQFALQNSKNFVLISTLNSLQSEWVKTEYETFYNEFYIQNKNERKLILLKGIGFNISDVPLLLRRLQLAETVEQIIKSLIVSPERVSSEEELERKALEEKRQREQQELERKALEEKRQREQQELERKALEEKRQREQQELERKALEEKRQREQQELERKALKEKQPSEHVKDKTSPPNKVSTGPILKKTIGAIILICSIAVIVFLINGNQQRMERQKQLQERLETITSLKEELNKKYYSLLSEQEGSGLDDIIISLRKTSLELDKQNLEDEINMSIDGYYDDEDISRIRSKIEKLKLY